MKDYSVIAIEVRHVSYNAAMDVDDKAWLEQGADAILELESENARLRAELDKAENERVGILGEIAGLKSSGPYSVCDNMILAEDEGVMFNPAFPQAICDKLNQQQARIAELEAKFKNSGYLALAIYSKYGSKIDNEYELRAPKLNPKVENEGWNDRRAYISSETQRFVGKTSENILRAAIALLQKGCTFGEFDRAIETALKE